MGIARSPELRISARARDEVTSVIDRDELVPVFQPVMDLRTGLVAGYEALARFTRGRRRSTAEWFNDAHRCGVGLRLEAHAARKALAVARRPFGSFVSLNASGAALLSKDFGVVLPASLDNIVIELTGQGPPQPDDQLREARRQISLRGGRLAVDLAGSDYAGLRQMMWAAPDLLKLDRAVVHRVSADPAKSALVEVLVRYARERGILVWAEAVESLDDLERLAELDVTYAQGHAIGRPAKPWQAVDPDAARTCMSSVAASLTGAHAEPDGLGMDGRLQWLAWKLSEATTFAELAGAVEAIQIEIGSDDLQISVIDGDELVVVGAGGPDRLYDRYLVSQFPETERLLNDRDSTQVLVSDPEADPAEVAVLRRFGYGSVLMLPICCGGRTIGLFEAYSRAQRPWSRFEIGRARIIALQLGATLERISR